MQEKKKISQLTPKERALDSTDLLMISEVAPDGYATKSITGAEIITSAQQGRQATLISGTNIKTVNDTSLLGSGNVSVQPTLVSGTNIKTVNSTSLLGSGNITIQTNPTTLASGTGLNLTGTTNQISASVLIPAGTLTANKSIWVRNILTKTAGSTTSTPRIYMNTTNSLTGATLIASAQTMNGSTYFQRFERNFLFDGTNLICISVVNGFATDLTASTISNVAFNNLVDNYLIFAVQNSTTTPDNLGHKKYIVQIYD